jgi:hypothetical protein
VLKIFNVVYLVYQPEALMHSILRIKEKFRPFANDRKKKFLSFAAKKGLPPRRIMWKRLEGTK